MYVTKDPALGYTLENWARLRAVASIPIMEIRKTSGTDGPASDAITVVVKKRLNAGAICAMPGIITPSSPSFFGESRVSPGVASAGDVMAGVLGVRSGMGCGWVRRGSGAGAAQEVDERGVE